MYRIYCMELLPRMRRTERKFWRVISEFTVFGFYPKHKKIKQINSGNEVKKDRSRNTVTKTK